MKSALKYDSGKPDLSMVSLELVEEVAYVRMFGANEKKPIPYGRDNWKQGFKVTRSCASALRHIFKFLSGETNDPESGRPHLAHAVCCLEHAIYDMRHRPENDDRYRPTKTVSEPEHPYTVAGMPVTREAYDAFKRDEGREINAIAP